MKILITEAVELAFNAFFNVLGNDTYKEQYHSTHFNPVGRHILLQKKCSLF